VAISLIVWKDTTFEYDKGEIQIPGITIGDAYDIILVYAKRKSCVYYSDVINELKRRGHKKISRRTIGSIVGEVSIQISLATNPSIYPSSIVVRKDTENPGEGFWGVDTGTSPPSSVPLKERSVRLKRYQNDLFDWSSEL
jgi:hypothetical protein